MLVRLSGCGNWSHAVLSVPSPDQHTDRLFSTGGEETGKLAPKNRANNPDLAAGSKFWIRRPPQRKGFPQSFRKTEDLILKNRFISKDHMNI